MYYNQFFKVSAKFHNVDLEGKEAKCSETFLIEALNFAEAYTAVLDLITKTTTFPDTIEIQKIEQAKFEELVVTDSMENENCINNNYVELFADHEIGIFVYDVKIAFETEDHAWTVSTLSIQPFCQVQAKYKEALALAASGAAAPPADDYASALFNCAECLQEGAEATVAACAALPDGQLTLAAVQAAAGWADPAAL